MSSVEDHAVLWVLDGFIILGDTEDREVLEFPVINVGNLPPERPCKFSHKPMVDKLLEDRNSLSVLKDTDLVPKKRWRLLQQLEIGAWVNPFK